MILSGLSGLNRITFTTKIDNKKSFFFTTMIFCPFQAAKYFHRMAFPYETLVTGHHETFITHKGLILSYALFTHEPTLKSATPTPLKKVADIFYNYQQDSPFII